MTKKFSDDPRQMDLFKVAAVHHFPLHRRAALVRGVAATMVKKPTQKQRLGYLNRELNFQAAILLKNGMTFPDLHEQVIQFRDKVVSEYHRLIFASSSSSDHHGDDAA